MNVDIHPPCADYNFLMGTGRWKEVTVPTAQKGLHVTFAVLYGLPTAGNPGKDYETNEAFISAMIRRAKRCKDMPYVFGGDINFDPEKSRVLAAAIKA